jgi:hypothetical protein
VVAIAAARLVNCDSYRVGVLERHTMIAGQGDQPMPFNMRSFFPLASIAKAHGAVARAGGEAGPDEKWKESLTIMAATGSAIVVVGLIAVLMGLN